MGNAGAKPGKSENPSRIRIDAAHPVAHGPSDPNSAAAIQSAALQTAALQTAAVHSLSAGEDVDTFTEQMQVQAGQLARHLQDRRKTVDQREAQLNARIAQLENELRVARLWQREQSQEFAERENDLRQQLAGYEARMAGLALAEAGVEEARQKLIDLEKTQNDELIHREQSLQESQRRLHRDMEQLAHDRQRLELDRKRLEEERCDGKVQDALQELACLQQAHTTQFQEWQDEQARWRHSADERDQQLAAKFEAFQIEQRRWQEEKEQQQRLLEEQRQQVTQQRVAAERSRSEVVQLHRESLEMRWVAEQLWIQLNDRLPAADPAAGAIKLRGQLSDEYRFQQQELDQRHAEIQKLLETLDGKRAELIEQRRELVAWFGRRQWELSQRAQELDSLEQTLRKNRDEFAERQQHWQSERIEVLQQLRASVLAANRPALGAAAGRRSA